VRSLRPELLGVASGKQSGPSDKSYESKKTG
jgi:hypothetical protein